MALFNNISSDNIIIHIDCKMGPILRSIKIKINIWLHFNGQIKIIGDMYIGIFLFIKSDMCFSIIFTSLCQYYIK